MKVLESVASFLLIDLHDIEVQVTAFTPCDENLCPVTIHYLSVNSHLTDAWRHMIARLQVQWVYPSSSFAGP